MDPFVESFAHQFSVVETQSHVLKFCYFAFNAILFVRNNALEHPVKDNFQCNLECLCHCPWKRVHSFHHFVCTVQCAPPYEKSNFQLNGNSLHFRLKCSWVYSTKLRKHSEMETTDTQITHAFMFVDLNSAKLFNLTESRVLQC